MNTSTWQCHYSWSLKQHFTGYCRWFAMKYWYSYYSLLEKKNKLRLSVNKRTKTQSKGYMLRTAVCAHKFKNSPISFQASKVLSSLSGLGSGSSWPRSSRHLELHSNHLSFATSFYNTLQHLITQEMWLTKHKHCSFCLV